jgi:acyl-[acyl-carrier-protein]-phospholipid O-acyltransferase/long-chain-fatty-acid--[acyl-carrier-protein] ligase
MTESYRPARSRRSHFKALVDARREFGGKTQILVDGDGRTLTYDETLRAVLALGSALARLTEKDEKVGVLLPDLGTIERASGAGVGFQ